MDVMEIMAQDMSQIIELAKTNYNYAAQVFNVQGPLYGAKGDGLVDDSTALQTVINAASLSGGIVFFPPGTYKTGGQTVPINVSLWFANGAKLSINNAAVVTINGFIQAGSYTVFSGSGTVTYNATNVEAYPEWWGAKGDGATDNTSSLQNMLNSLPSGSVIKFSPRSYYFASTVQLPQGKLLTFRGSGYRMTKLIGKASIGNLFNYLRVVGQSGVLIVFEGIEFTEQGLGKTSRAVKFYGAYTGTQGSETKYDDNWLRMYDCSFYGWSHAVELGYCGQVFFVRCYGQANGAVYFLTRDASFVNWYECMNLSNDNFIFADDSLADGVSNGMNIQNCQSVFSNNADVRVLGWQSVYIHGGGGFDIGGTGDTNSIYLGKCMDFNINGMWISANKSANRNCIYLDECHSGEISGNSIVNAGAAGIRVSRNAAKNCAINITNNKFDGNVHNDIILSGNVVGAIITGNKILSNPSRTGFDFEIFANTGGTDYCIIKNNTFRNASYTITAGANSIVNENIFGLGYV